ncbi:hypothetical protein FJ364_05930 [Candidatus Dependentiae bacterium]|nr:hypothetical protein [Candidatus Dependentiae bacterium]
MKPTLYVVHCIDTEGPLTETLEATFERIESVFGFRFQPTHETLCKLQRKEIDLGGQEVAVAKMIAPELLAYNSTWDSVYEMLKDAMSEQFRNRMIDDFGNGWAYSWHCIDHMYYQQNPRQKEVGYGKVFRFYRNILKEFNCHRDELNWHFHPVSLTKYSLHAATSYTNSYFILNEILCRRIMEDNWFPVVNRPGFHSERPDSHAFLEQWIPFDYANQVHEEEDNQPDCVGGRFGDWRRAPTTWRGYHPHHDDYQQRGSCRRIIFRCLNVGTRLRALNLSHVEQAFCEAQKYGKAILAFADHDYRDIRPDVNAVRSMLFNMRKKFPDVQIRFSGAEEAARELLEKVSEPAPQLSLELNRNLVFVRLKQGNIFGPQPFLVLKDQNDKLYHDNLDFQEPGCLWSYVLDEQTLPLEKVVSISVGCAGRYGKFSVVHLKLKDE